MTSIQLLFYLLSGMLLISASCVISTRHPVKAVLFLMLAFLSCSGLWLLLESEFLALVLLFVYVGAVMTLFLFVVMMLNLNQLPVLSGKIVKRALFALGGGLGISFFIIQALQAANFGFIGKALVSRADNYSDTKTLGKVLYTHHLLSFELAGVILLVAIIAAIGLVFRGERKGTKHQNVKEQLETLAKDRLTIVHDEGNNI